MKPHIKFHLFEDDLFSHPIHGPEFRMGELRRFASSVWLDLKPNKPIPRIVAGRGAQSADGRSLTSYEMAGRIVLARHHRYRIIVLHELAHYLADDPPPYHGTKFFRTYRSLILKYADPQTAALADTLTHVHNLHPGD